MSITQPGLSSSLSLPCCLFIILIFPILPITGTCNIAQTVSDSNHHAKKHFFGQSDCQSRIFSCLRIFMFLPTRCLCVFNSQPCPGGFPLTITLIHFSFSSLLKKCVCRRFSATSFFLYRNLSHAPRARTLSASKPLFPSFA